MALHLGELVAGLRADDSGFVRGLNNAQLRMHGLTRDVNGQLRDLHGRFVSAGTAGGQALGDGIGDGADRAAGRMRVLNGTIRMAAVAIAGMSAGALGAAGLLAALPLLVIGFGAKILAENKQVAGAFSDLGEHVKSEMAQLAQPLVKPFVQAAAQLRQIFDEIAPYIGQAFAAVAPMIGPLVDGIGAFATGVMPGFVSALESAQPVVEALSSGLGDVGAGLGGFFEGVAGGSDGAAAALSALLGAVGSILPVAGQLIGILAKLGGPILAGVMGAIEPLIGLVGEAASGLGVLVDKIPPGVLKAIGAAFVVIALGVKAYSVAMGLASTATKLWAAAQAMFNAVMAANPIGIVIGVLVALGAAIYIAYQKSETFRNAVAVGWAFIKAAISAAVEGIKAAINWFAGLPAMISGWFGAAKAAAVRQFTALVGWLRGLPARAGGALAGLVGSLRTAASNGFNAFKSAAAARASAFLGWVRGLPRRIASAIGSLSGLLVSKGRDVVRGLWNGIKAMGGWIKDQIMGWAKSVIPGPVADALGISSPSKVMAEQVGRWIPAGIAQGAEANAGVLDKTMSNLVSTPTPSMALTASPAAASSSQAPTRTRDVRVSFGDSELDNWIVGRLREAVGARGGNVQFVLGR